MVIMENTWNAKEEIPTTRWWLMLKLRLGMDKRYDQYIFHLKEQLVDMMTVPSDLKGTDAIRAKAQMARHITDKLERSAYRTLPSEFLRDLGIPRVLRH